MAGVWHVLFLGDFFGDGSMAELALAPAVGPEVWSGEKIAPEALPVASI